MFGLIVMLFSILWSPTTWLTSNILVQPDTFNVRIIDNVRVLDMNQLSYFIFNDYFRCHTLPYISPEMTGKICYSIDYTSDIYSLGTIFYEIFEIAWIPICAGMPVKNSI